MARNTKAPDRETAPPVQKKGHPIFKVVGIIVLIMAILLVYLYVQFGNLALSLASTLSSGQQPNSTTLQSVMFEKVNAMPNATANYSGTITIKHDPPFQFSFTKSGNHVRYSLTAQNLTGFGTVMILFIGSGPLGSAGMNGTMCLNDYGYGGFSDSPAMEAVRSFGRWESPYYCLNTDGNTSIIDGFLNAFVNLTSLSNITIKSYGLDFGRGCYSISGSGNIEVNSSMVGAFGSDAYTPATLNFTACLSGQNNLPVSISANLTAHDTGIPYEAVPSNPNIDVRQFVNQTMLTGEAVISGTPTYNEYFCAGTGGGGVLNWTTDAQAYNATWLQPQPTTHPITPSPQTAPGGFGEPQLNYYQNNFASVGHKNGSTCSASLYQPNAKLNTLSLSQSSYMINKVTYGEACVHQSTFYVACENVTGARFYPMCLDSSGCNNTFSAPLHGKIQKSNLYVITCASLYGCNVTNQVLHYIQPNQSYDWLKQQVVTSAGYSDSITIDNISASTVENYSELWNFANSYQYPIYGGPMLTSIGLLDPPPYTLASTLQVANDSEPNGSAMQNNTYYMNYTVSANHSFLLISLACASLDCAVTVPSGCKSVTYALGSNDEPSNLMYLCMQDAGQYSMRVKTYSARYIAGAVYNFGPTGNTTVGITLNQSAFTQSASPSQVTALP